ncbi:DUF3152 domain-containing protein [Streptomyces sp. NPDC001339]|uniref:DUF3152 domain-containing protein n=1 Tax=Streptomyces sp. NPDC001339 TaxID=3364563 RepID=UPI0036873F27
MGRHSRRGRPESAADAAEPVIPTTGAPTTGAPVPGPGPGRRRRAPADGDTARGGHPEQREPGGGWGAFPGAPASPVPPERTAPRVPRPRTEMPGAPRTETPGAQPPVDFPLGPVPGGAPGGGARAVPDGGRGPRREYVEAFDRRLPGADHAAGAPDGPVGPEAAHGVAAGGFDAARGPAESGADDGAGEGPDTVRHGAGRGGRGRTFTGAAAAAVTTVLAVVIAGQVAEQREAGGAQQPRSGSDRADGGGDTSRSHNRPTPAARPATYDEKMAQVFPLSADMTAGGRFRPVGGDAKAPGSGTVKRYRVDIEEGLPLDGELFAEAVHRTLNDERSWAHGGQRTFQRVASGHADFVITLASPGTTAKWCAKSGLDTTEDNVSCDSAMTERVMINAYRWAQGATTYGPDKMFAYRQMLINHETGHRLGHDHESCSRRGALAPVMMQQTKFLTTDGATCRPNAWPFPAGS